MFSFSPIKKNLDSIAFAALGFFIIYLFTRHNGIGICPDGVVYTTAAENLRTNGTYTDFTHGPVIDFPAFYSIFLSGIMLLTGLKILVFAPYLNAFLFAIIIYLAGNIMEQFEFRSKWYKAAILSAIVLSPGLLEDYSMMWSETIFILFLLLFIMAMHRYLEINSRKALIAAAVITSIACVTRYAGITIIATGGIFILLNTKLSLWKRFADGIIFSVISSSLLVINLWRNYHFSETLAGDREQSTTPLIQNVHDTGVVFSDWLPFLRENYITAVVVTIAIIAGLSIFILKKLFQDRRIAGYENISAFFALFYILFMIVTATISRFEPLNSRFMTPAFIFLLWSGSNWLIFFSHQTKASVKKWSFAALGIFMLFSFQWNQLAADAETWDGVKDAGIPGYTEDEWTKSETVLFIQKDSLHFKKGYTIYSDANDAIYWFTKRAGEFLPAKEYKPGVKEFLNDPHCYVVWFDDGENFDLVDKTFLTETKKMKLVKQFNDGAIYEYDAPAFGSVK
jgi:hypothetical protein